MSGVEKAPRIVADKFKHLIPPLLAEEHKLLEESLYSEGCRDQLSTWIDPNSNEEILLDGHNRYEICERLGIPYETQAIELPEGMFPEEWIIRNQLGRRNVTPYSRAVLALGMEKIFREQARKNQKASGGPVPKISSEPVETREKVAAIAGVSHDTVRKVKILREEGGSELIDSLKAGCISINAAFNRLRDDNSSKKRTVERSKSSGNIEYNPEDHRLELDKATEKVFGANKPKPRPISENEIIQGHFDYLNESIASVEEHRKEVGSNQADCYTMIKTLKRVRDHFKKTVKGKVPIRSFSERKETTFDQAEVQTNNRKLVST